MVKSYSQGRQSLISRGSRTQFKLFRLRLIQFRSSYLSTDLEKTSFLAYLICLQILLSYSIFQLSSKVVSRPVLCFLISSRMPLLILALGGDLGSEDQRLQASEEENQCNLVWRRIQVFLCFYSDLMLSLRVFALAYLLLTNLVQCSITSSLIFPNLFQDFLVQSFGDTTLLLFNSFLLSLPLYSPLYSPFFTSLDLSMQLSLLQLSLDYFITDQRAWLRIIL